MSRGIYFTSDWHIGHAKVIEYSNRPFKDVNHMNRVLINNYNASVGPDDLCYFLGDMGMTNTDQLKKACLELNGTKILIMGNHDKKGIDFWRSCGFSAIMHSSSTVIAKRIVTMSHCPLYGVYREDVTGMKRCDGTENWHGEHRQYANGYSLPDFGQFHLHGHIHSPNRGKSTKILDRQFDVGVDANNYTPVNISVIESWVAKYGQ